MHKKVAIVDASKQENQRLIEEYQLKAYPTIKWVSRGAHHEFRGPKTVVGMLNWIDSKIK